MNLKQVGSNMTELRLNDGTIVLFSYETPVAAVGPTIGYIVTSAYYSRTTTKHINMWMNCKEFKKVDQSVLNELVNNMKQTKLHVIDRTMLSHITDEDVKAMREWLKDCAWANDVDFDSLTRNQIIKGVMQYYEGSVAQFLRDGGK